MGSETVKAPLAPLGALVIHDSAATLSKPAWSRDSQELEILGERISTTVPVGAHEQRRYA